MTQILYVDDEPANIALFRRWFGGDFSVATAASANEALALMDAEEVSVVVSDQRMDGMTGIELLAVVAKRAPIASRILLTAYSDRDLLLAAIQQGQVHDYVLKPWDGKDLELRLRRALDASLARQNLESARAERDFLRKEVSEQYPPVVGLDGDLAPLAETISRVASTDSTVMIRGESGAGKEIVAREIHRRSPRADKPFVRVNCSAFAEGVLESELFGHEAGAFTGARSTRIGRFEQAQRGTLFLDEIGDVSPGLQVKLLRTIQEREIERVGGNRTIRLDIRLIAATHQNLEALVQRQQFRSDLFFRLNVIPLVVPPLRERARDLNALTDYFIAMYATLMGKRLTITDEARESLRRYDWPGNVRELRNVIERAAALADPIATLDIDDFNPNFGDVTAPRPNDAGRLFEEIALDEGAKIRDALRASGGNKARAARLLGIARTTLNDRIERFGIR